MDAGTCERTRFGWEVPDCVRSAPACVYKSENSVGVGHSAVEATAAQHRNPIEPRHTLAGIVDSTRIENHELLHTVQVTGAGVIVPIVVRLAHTFIGI